MSNLLGQQIERIKFLNLEKYFHFLVQIVLENESRSFCIVKEITMRQIIDTTMGHTRLSTI